MAKRIDDDYLHAAAVRYEKISDCAEILSLFITRLGETRKYYKYLLIYLGLASKSIEYRTSQAVVDAFCRWK